MSQPLGAPEHRDGGRLFWVTAAAGWCIIGGAIVGAFADRREAQPLDLARWVVAVALVHDLVWLPVVALVGVALSRATRGRRPPRAVLWALATSALLTLVAWPFVRGYGRQPGNPSLLPRNYAAGLAAFLVVIWASALTVVVVGAVRRNTRRDGRRADPRPEELTG